jgi:hypothetical protein
MHCGRKKEYSTHLLALAAMPAPWSSWLSKQNANKPRVRHTGAIIVIKAGSKLDSYPLGNTGNETDHSKAEKNINSMDPAELPI